MAHRIAARALSHFAALSLVLLFSHAALAQPAITSVVSRMTHGVAGTFDIPLPQSGEGGIESRTLTGGVKLVITFNLPVTGGTAAMAAGNTFATVNGPPTFSGNTMTVNLAAVQNAKTIAITLSNVTDNIGGTLASADISFRTLEGDINASGTVTAADVNLCNANINKTLNYGNFRADVTVTNGAISTADTTLVKSRINTSVGTTPAPNTPPTLSAIADQTTPLNTALPGIALTVGDAESSPDMLLVTATSSDTSIVPNAGITITPTGASRSMSITPTTGATGNVTITVRVTDGVMTTNGTFAVNVGAAQKLYLADLRAATPTLKTRGLGSAAILLSADETQAVVRLNYNGLTSNKTGAEVRGPADIGQTGNVLFDLSTAVPQEDGSYVWVFAPSGITVQDLRDALRAGKLYALIKTTNNPSGELRGQFYLATGNQNFTPPPPPPAIVAGTPDQDAARFLIQATFGPSAADIDALKAMPGGINAWLDQQFNTPTTSMLEILKTRVAQTPPNVYAIGGSNITDIWWNLALTSNDQLRQRVAFALSQLFVVSKIEETIDGQPAAVAGYHDMLANNAFGNFRTLMNDVTLHPIMGQYLNMRGNKKQTSPTAPLPNENYAREILQLFTIGLNALHPDGSIRLGPDGFPLTTYDQDTIQNFAQIFTGWDLGSANYTFPYWNTGLLPNPGMDTYSTKWVLPMIVTASNHATVAKTLLNGFTIPANGSMTSAAANAELKAALDNIFNHPNVPPFISRQLIQRLVTSNPSPAYVYRVAEVFRDNGSGVRGDLKAVVRAILTDYEARSIDVIGNSSYGRLKEPVLRVSHVIRALHPTSNAAAPLNYFRLASTDSEFLQTPYRSPTVFNFYEPAYLITVDRYASSTGPKYTEVVNTPEMQITNENTVISIDNFFKTALIPSGTTATSGTYSSSSDVRTNVTTEAALCTSTTNSTPIITLCNKVFLAGTLPSQVNTQLDNYYKSRTVAGDSIIRARGVIYLTITSPQFAIQK